MNEPNSFLRKFSSKVTRIFLPASIFLFYSFWMILKFRPIQDDYVTLERLAIDGFWGPTKDVWGNLGGNVSTVLLRSMLLWDSRNSPNFYGLRLFPFLTFLVVVLGVHFFTVLCGSVPRLKESIVVAVILAVGMEGLFTPGIIGVFNFSAASMVHFWPICLLPTIIWLVGQQQRLRVALGYLLVMFAANANITESIMYVAVFLFMCVQRKVTRLKWLFAVLCSSLSLVAILIAPGFSKRTAIFAQERDLSQIPSNFLKNSAIFCIDILTHPLIVILFISGAALPTLQKLVLSKSIFNRILLLEVTYLLLSITGSTFAYPAWHQSLGLIPLAAYSSYLIGTRFKVFFPKISRKNFTIALLILVLPIICRLSWKIDHRAEKWDSDFQSTNLHFSEHETQRAEIVYPPFGLGVEDIYTWEWMADPFYSWKSRLKNNYKSIEWINKLLSFSNGSRLSLA